MKRIIILNIVGVLSVLLLITTSVLGFYESYGVSSYAVGFISFTLAMYGCALLAHVNSEYTVNKESHPEDYKIEL